MSAEPGPYGFMAMHYLNSGWSPIPIVTKDGNKKPLVGGCSGYKGKYPTKDQVAEWQRQFGQRMVGLRLPKRVVGIDIDLYDGKAGARTVGVLQGKWGKLPATWMSSSRTDGSGIRMYQLPDGVNAAVLRDPSGYMADGSKFGGVEVVRYCHRFVTVFPSKHGREGGPRYWWFNPDGHADEVEIEFPSPTDLPLLPVGWCEGMSIGADYSDAPGGGRLPAGGPTEWLKARPLGDGPMCCSMRRDVTDAIKEIQEAGAAGGCHPAMGRWIFAIVGNAAEGHTGAFPAAVAIGNAYVAAVSARRPAPRSRAVLRSETRRSIEGAIVYKGAECDATDPCTDFAELANWGSNA